RQREVQRRGAVARREGRQRQFAVGGREQLAHVRIGERAGAADVGAVHLRMHGPFVGRRGFHEVEVGGVRGTQRVVDRQRARDVGARGIGRIEGRGRRRFRAGRQVHGGGDARARERRVVAGGQLQI